MNLPHHDEQITTLTLSDFGPIAKAEFSVCPLTIFEGRNRTGKSVLATLLYAMHNTFFSPVSPGGDARAQRQALAQAPQYSFEPGEPRKGLADALVDCYEAKDGRRGGQESGQSANRAFAELVDAKAALLAAVLEEDIMECFHVADVREMIWAVPSSGEMTLQCADNETGAVLRHKVLLGGKQGCRVKMDMPEAALARAREGLLHLMDDGGYGLGMAADGVLLRLLLSGMTGPFNRRASYLPANRGGLFMDYRSMVASRISDFTQSGREQRSSPLARTSSDFLMALYNLQAKQDKGAGGTGNALAQVISDGEWALLGGRLSVRPGPGLGLPEFCYRPGSGKTGGKALPIIACPDSVRDLAPLIIWLRYVVRPGDVLIIDEPVQCLDQDGAKALAVMLMKLALNGIRVILTTADTGFADCFETIQSEQSDLLPDARAGIIARCRFAGAANGDGANVTCTLPDHGS